MSNYIWRMAEPPPDTIDKELAEWPLLLKMLLYNRGLANAEDAEGFLYPEKAGMHDPRTLLGIDLAVERVLRALEEEQLIAIYGDFDVDGLTSTALLMEVLQSPDLGGRVIAYLPHRGREGYGLNTEAVKGLAQQGVKLLITADCGIGADEEIKLASGLGIDVIVTDHHQISKGLPPAFAVVNPRQGSCPYPFKDLAGVGVAYKLAEALLAAIWNLQEARARLEPSLDLVALGTVGDLAPLFGENRLMVKLGLRAINEGSRLGLRSLATVAGLRGRTLDVETVSYYIVPRLNAAGRMGDARLSLDLLLCRTEAEANRLATELDAANRDRQAATTLAISAARAEVSRAGDLPPAIFLAGAYPAGIVGLVANRLVDEFNRPAFVVELGQAECRGSGRGVQGFNVVQTLAGASDLLVRFGGHSQAAGFAVAASKLDELRAYLLSVAGQYLAEESRPELFLEGELKARDLRPGLYEMLLLLEPYGIGNRRPLFYSRGLYVRDVRVVGSGHLKMWLLDETGGVAAIGFGMATDEYAFVRPGIRVDCAYAVGRNERGGTFAYEMVLKDVRPST